MSQGLHAVLPEHAPWPPASAHAAQDPVARLLGAADRVVDVVSAGWEHVLATAPELITRLSIEPDQATGGIDVGLQLAGSVCRRFVALPGVSAVRAEAYEAIVRRRLALTRPEVLTAEPDAFVALSAWSREPIGSRIPQVAALVGVLADVQAADPSRALGQASAAAVIDLADVAVGLDDGRSTHDAQLEVRLWRRQLIQELHQRSLSWDDAASEAFPRVWDPAMDRALLDDEHPLRQPYHQLVAAIEGLGDREVPVSAPEFARELFWHLLATADPAPRTYSAGLLLAALGYRHPSMIWTPLLLSAAAVEGAGSPDSLARLLCRLARPDTLIARADIEAVTRRVAAFVVGIVGSVSPTGETLRRAGAILEAVETPGVRLTSVPQESVPQESAPQLVEWPELPFGLAYVQNQVDALATALTALREIVRARMADPGSNAAPGTGPESSTEVEPHADPQPERATERVQATEPERAPEPEQEPAWASPPRPRAVAPSADEADDGEAWRAAPMVLTHINRGTMKALRGEVDACLARLVSLSEPLSVPVLARQLLPPLAVQPDADEAAQSLVLVYRCQDRPPSAELHPGYVLVDLLALMDVSWLLRPDLYASFMRALPSLSMISDPALDHVVARARWRRSVPAEPEQVRQYVEVHLRRSPSWARLRGELAAALATVLGDDEALTRRLASFCLIFDLPEPVR